MSRQSWKSGLAGSKQNGGENKSLRMIFRFDMVAKVRAGVETGFADHEHFKYTSLPLRREPFLDRDGFRVRRSANLFNPERHFFVEAPWSDSQSIPVRVVAGKAMKPEKRAGAGRYVRTHPPRITEQRFKLYEAGTCRHSVCCNGRNGELLTIQEKNPNLPFLKEKRS